MFYWSPRLKRGTLYIFRPGAPDDSCAVRLKGLDPERTYRVWSEDGSVLYGHRKGAELMTEGVVVRLISHYTCDLVYVREEAARPRLGTRE
jgi:hypothetical protein